MPCTNRGEPRYIRHELIQLDCNISFSDYRQIPCGLAQLRRAESPRFSEWEAQAPCLHYCDEQLQARHSLYDSGRNYSVLRCTVSTTHRASWHVRCLDFIPRCFDATFRPIPDNSRKKYPDRRPQRKLSQRKLSPFGVSANRTK